MDRSLQIRALMILAILALAGMSIYPPEEKINLGLDLRGGMHLVLQVKTDDAVRAETENTADTVVSQLKDEGVNGVEVEFPSLATFELLGVPAEQDDFLDDEVVGRRILGWKMRRLGDRLQFELDAGEVSNLRQLAVNQARETIRNRVDTFGVSEPVIHDEGLGSERIVVQLPGVDDPDRVEGLIKNTAFLEFRLVKENSGFYSTLQEARAALAGSDANKYEVMVEDVKDDDQVVVGERFLILEKRRVITGRDLKTARVSSGDFNQPVVLFILTGDGGRKFGEVTSANIGRQLAIVLDGRVMSAPSIESRITDQGTIHGQFSQQEVQDLVTVLRSGALPAELVTLEKRSVGPTLGLDSIIKGRKAGLIGGLLVVLTMLLVYKLTGINAVLALSINIVLVFGCLSLFGATLTLPGIAGIVLTIGMAVDANVLIFERIKEELASGRTVNSAIAAGFSNAWSSIRDANITTLIASVFLFTFGTGPIRGFAVTLSIGILASVFSAVVISRWLFDAMYSRRRAEKLSI
jgi:preprotein translocase subunit SecD